MEKVYIYEEEIPDMPIVEFITELDANSLCGEPHGWYSLGSEKMKSMHLAQLKAGVWFQEAWEEFDANNLVRIWHYTVCERKGPYTIFNHTTLT